MLYIIGLGLGDIKDITVKGLEIVKKCEKVKMDKSFHGLDNKSYRFRYI